MSTNSCHLIVQNQITPNQMHTGLRNIACAIFPTARMRINLRTFPVHFPILYRKVYELLLHSILRSIIHYVYIIVQCTQPARWPNAATATRLAKAPSSTATAAGARGEARRGAARRGGGRCVERRTSGPPGGWSRAAGSGFYSCSVDLRAATDLGAAGGVGLGIGSCSVLTAACLGAGCAAPQLL